MNIQWTQFLTSSHEITLDRLTWLKSINDDLDTHNTDVIVHDVGKMEQTKKYIDFIQKMF